MSAPIPFESAPVSLQRDLDEFGSVLADVRKRMVTAEPTPGDIEALDQGMAHLKRLKFRIETRLRRRTMRLREMLG